MKTVGLIGGMSWESTTDYYQKINVGIKEHLGGLHSGKILMYSFDFQEIEDLQHKNEWDELAKLLSEAGNNLKKAGADFLAICTNTMHKVADRVEEEVGLDILHIADMTAKEIINEKIKTVGLLGTNFTMSEDFYKKRLYDKYGINILIPKESEREVIHKIIYDELCCGQIKEESKKEFIKIINNMKMEGIEGIILGCTEIPMLIQQKDLDIKVFDTAEIHSKYIVKMMLENNL